jgi:hypothetical protein
MPAMAGGETDQIVRHMKTRYKAKKVKIPFMWLARVAVRIVKPAGVKSFKVTLFEGLQIEGESVDREMQLKMRESFGPDWSPILRVKSREGQQVYMYMRDAGESSVKIALVSIDGSDAAVIRATINPDRLADFIDNPRIFGVGLSNKNEPRQTSIEAEKPK